MPASRRASFLRTSRCCRRPPTETTGGNPFNEHVVVAKKGDSVASILRDLGATPDDIGTVAAVLGPRGRDGGLKEGQKLRVLMTPGRQSQQAAADPRHHRQRQLASTRSSRWSDTGKYVSVDVKNVDTEVAEIAADDDENDGTRRAALSERLRDRAAQPDPATRSSTN